MRISPCILVQSQKRYNQIQRALAGPKNSCQNSTSVGPPMDGKRVYKCSHVSFSIPSFIAPFRACHKLHTALSGDLARTLLLALLWINLLPAPARDVAARDDTDQITILFCMLVISTKYVQDVPIHRTGVRTAHNVAYLKVPTERSIMFYHYSKVSLIFWGCMCQQNVWCMLVPKECLWQHFLCQRRSNIRRSRWQHGSLRCVHGRCRPTRTGTEPTANSRLISVRASGHPYKHALAT